MAKRTVRIGNMGVVDLGTSNRTSVATSTEVIYDAAVVENTLVVAANATGTMVNHPSALVVAPGLLILPANPVLGQKVVVGVVGNAAFGVSASHTINNASLAVDLSASNTTAGMERTFRYLSAAGVTGWISLAEGGVAGTSGSYTF